LRILTTADDGSLNERIAALSSSVRITGDTQISGATVFYKNTALADGTNPPSNLSLTTIDPTSSTTFPTAYNTYGAIRTPVATTLNLTLANIYGNLTEATHQGASSSTVGNLVSTYAQAQNTGGGTINNAYALTTSVTTSSSGIINTGYSVNISDMSAGGSYNITNRYAVWQDGTSDINHWRGKSRFLGDTQASGTTQIYGPLIMHSGSALNAPGASNGMLRWEPGTNAGTLKLVAYAGTSTAGTTVLDNIGAGN
jgi:hypothetical protein